MKTTRKVRMAVTTAAAALLLWGCDTDTESVDLTDESRDVTVAELGRIGAQVYLEPDRADEIVEAAGLTPEAFEDRIRSITNDRGRALTYARSFEAEVAAARAATSEEGASGDDDETASGDTGGTSGAPGGTAPSQP